MNFSWRTGKAAQAASREWARMVSVVDLNARRGMHAHTGRPKGGKQWVYVIARQGWTYFLGDENGVSS